MLDNHDNHHERATSSGAGKRRADVAAHSSSGRRLAGHFGHHASTQQPGELRLCLERLFASTYTRYEVIVVDDASTDESAQVAADMGCSVLQLGSASVPRGHETGSQVARGEYLFFLDSDVCVYPTPSRS